MKKASPNVIEILSVGIGQYTQNLITMMFAYEDEYDSITLEEIRIAYTKLEEAILFYKSHTIGLKRFQAYELLLELNRQVRSVLNEDLDFLSMQHTFPLPKGIKIFTETEDRMYYVVIHEELGHIGRVHIIFMNKFELFIETEMDETDKEDIEKETILQLVAETIKTNILQESF
ncbi:hypothetical protein ICM_05651 [Bacillus cereus BAG1X2-3]|uniref:Uncharacterized protein n=1 Tax=Bacillus cereus TaxID=1396 RepID=A0A9X7E0X1_BACCE|nr:hypothetical protein [Bacillus cereus]EOO23299.1 hypothetical protein ICC_06185 [Bacillus cereus BAG1X1-1]EOO42891.1 hypothetical protein ICI_06228 [Bacillus cereus BAG1X2-1]EOO56405.1 hypothetical protein ICM_05651 [Bacillus cereus BAG1X2-3]EOP00124.1 hypothetical protein ICO_06551 [Bacillus cereus BAG2O-1]PHA08066.1 hypothetical protein COE70_32005 [Bacillus cereus]